MNMKTGGQLIKKEFDSKQQYTKQSNNIMRQIGNIKEIINPISSNSKMGDGGYKQKWYQYLPRDSQIPNNSASMRFKEEINSDQYRQSLEKRLQKLFRQQKEMFKERQYLSSAYKANDKGRRQSQPSQKFNIINNNLKISFQPFSIDHMQRKIKQLEERYKIKSNRQKQQQVKGLQKSVNNQKKLKVQKPQKSNNKKVEVQIEQDQPKQRVHSNSQMLTQTVEECIYRQRNLESQMLQLRKQMKELQQHNKLMSEKMNNRQQKRKRKHRTKQILSNILIKLQFINVEINQAKKRQYKEDQKEGINKIQNQTRQILAEFDKLKIQYKRLQLQRKKVQVRQNIIQDKLKKVHTQENPLQLK